jgi:hypothetical protein
LQERLISREILQKESRPIGRSYRINQIKAERPA